MVAVDDVALIVYTRIVENDTETNWDAASVSRFLRRCIRRALLIDPIMKKSYLKNLYSANLKYNILKFLRFLSRK